MKNFFIALLLLITLLYNDGIIISAPVKENVGRFIPENSDIILYVRNIDKSWKEFKSSYFYKKYKLTKNGKDLQRSIDSLSASFLIIGVTLNDLLEIFSEQGILAIWLNNNSITNYLYLIKADKNLSKMKSLMERLKYYAIANKINYNDVEYNNAKIRNFNNVVFLAKLDNYFVIGNNINLIRQTIDNINNFISTSTPNYNTINLFKNKNIIFFFNKNIIDYSVYYSLRFHKNLTIESITTNLNITNYKFSKSDLKYIPSDANFISTYNKYNDVKNIFFQILTMSDTNVVAFNKDDYQAYFDRFSMLHNDYINMVSIKLRSNQTNVLFIMEKNSITNSFTRTDERIRKKYIYTDNNQYLAVFKDRILVSNNKTWLKKSIEGYYKKNGFYYSKRKIRKKIPRKINIFLWMDMSKYLTKKALKYKKDKWTLYNAYLKTFRNIMLIGYDKKGYAYFRLNTFSKKK